MCSLASNIIESCWGLFVVIWIVASISTKRAVYRESGRQRLRYTLLLLVAGIFLFNARRFPYPWHLRLIPCTDTVAWACAISCVAGLAFCVSARAILGRNWSGTVTLKKDHELV